MPTVKLPRSQATLESPVPEMRLDSGSQLTAPLYGRGRKSSSSISSNPSSPASSPASHSHHHFGLPDFSRVLFAFLVSAVILRRPSDASAVEGRNREDSGGSSQEEAAAAAYFGSLASSSRTFSSELSDAKEEKQLIFIQSSKHSSQSSRRNKRRRIRRRRLPVNHSTSNNEYDNLYVSDAIDLSTFVKLILEKMEQKDGGQRKKQQNNGKNDDKMQNKFFHSQVRVSHAFNGSQKMRLVHF